MSRILITGGSGKLGRALTPLLLEAGHTVRVMSRREPNPGEDDGIERAVADLATGDGVAEATAGVDVIIHAASSAFRRTKQIDVEGTAHLLHTAKAANVQHFLYISIVAVDALSFSYYRYKWEAEQIIEAGDVPYTILRAPQFHYLIDGLFTGLAKLPVLIAPNDIRVNVMDRREVAVRMAELVQLGPSGRVPDIGGPERLSFYEMAEAWVAARGLNKRVAHLRMPGKFAAELRANVNDVPGKPYGRISWGDWLHETYGAPVAAPSHRQEQAI